MGGLNVMELKLKVNKWVMRVHGLGARMVELDNGSSIHCWLPLNWPHIGDAPSHKPALLLLHSFVVDGIITWEHQVPNLAKKFSLFIPDLLFFGKSRTSNKQRSEVFQAECMFALMEKLGVVQRDKLLVCGHSYGGFVAYRMAHLYPSFVKRVVIMSSSILMYGVTDHLPLLQQLGASKIQEFLIPQSALDFQKTLALVFHKSPWFPTFVLQDVFEVLDSNRQERHELIESMIIGTSHASQLPKVSQEVLIIWGEHDKVCSLDLACSMKNFLGDNATLTIIKDAGHMPHLEKPKKVSLAILAFFKS